MLFQYVIYRVTGCGVKRTINSEDDTCFSHVFNGTVHGNISFCINMKTAKCRMKTQHIQRYTRFISLRNSIKNSVSVSSPGSSIRLGGTAATVHLSLSSSLTF